MTWLIWKEYRLNRLILIVGATFLIVPHSIALICAWRGVSAPVGEGVSLVTANLLFSGFYSVALSQFTLTLLGGHAIACERVDRSAEFLAYQPLSRGRILAGKWWLVLITVAIVWGFNGPILLYVNADLLTELSAAERASARQAGWNALGYIAISGAVSFSVAWLFSSFLDSPTFAIFAGLITPILLISSINLVGWALGLSEDIVGPWYRGICLTLASVSLVGATWYYLRRIEP